MATQAALRFGSLYLCSPSNGRDGYGVPQYNPRKVDTVEVSIPGTAGTVLVQTGVGNSEQTSDSWEFEGEHYEPSDVSLHTWLNNCRAAAIDTRRPVQTLYYGLLDGGSTFTENNCRMMFTSRSIGHGGNPNWWYCRFTVTFTKVGE